MPDPICEIIQPPKQGLYHGAHVPDRGGAVTESSVSSFIEHNSRSEPELDLDIVLKFLKFGDGLNFPTREATLIAQKGGTIFIKMEPWSGRGEKDRSFSLENISRGKYDQLLKRFAEGAKRFGKPIFVSFGHEMNVSGYPWAMDPTHYKDAFRYVHDKLRKYGACNITWVWNPNIGGDLRSYYPDEAPNDHRVNWVAIDGYSSEDPGFSWQSCRELFSGSIDRLEKFKRPIMIGEFAADANSREDERTKKPAWIDQCVNYFAEDKRIKAYIYFNENKAEKGSPKRWALNSPQEKEAFRAAIQKFKELFIGRITTGKVEAPEEEMAGTKLVLPPGFRERDSVSANELINGNLSKIGKSKTRVISNDDQIKNADDSDQFRLGLRTKQYLAANFSEYILQWMLERENGNPKPGLLNESLRYKGYASPYWKTKVAFLIITGNPTIKEIKYLKDLGFALNINTAGMNDDASAYLSKSEKFALLENIYKSYINHKNPFDPIDPLLKGEMELQLANLAPNRGTARRYFNPASKSFEQIIANPKEIYQINYKRMRYMKGPLTKWADLEKDAMTEANFAVGQARALKGQIVILQAGELTVPELRQTLLFEVPHRLQDLQRQLKEKEAQLVSIARQGNQAETEKLNREIKSLKSEDQALKALIPILQRGGLTEPELRLNLLALAYRQLQASAGNQNIKGIHYQQLKRLAAECLTLISFILKDFEKKIKPPETINLLLSEISEWETELSLRSTTGYFALIQAARILITGVAMESVVEWEKAYNDKVKVEGNRSLWLKQVSAYARLWLAKAKMLIAGEMKYGLPKDEKFVKQQQDKLIEAENILLQIISNLDEAAFKKQLKDKLISDILSKRIGNKPDVLMDEGMAEVKKTLAENYARQGFILMDQGKREYTIYFSRARTLLQQAIDKGLPEVKAEAHLWLAKIDLVEAGKKQTERERKLTLARGLVELRQVFDPDGSPKKDDLGNSLLKGFVLSSAYQTKGDLLSSLKEFGKAEKVLRLAIDPRFPDNYYAYVSLGDVLNWEGNHAGALEFYKQVPSDSPAYSRAQLGIAEANMRRNEVYADAAIKELEKRAINNIFSYEAPASPLVARALEDLIEAYRTNEDLQEMPIYLAKILLGIKVDVELNALQEGRLMEILNSIDQKTRAAFEDKFKAELYLRTAEALLWRKRFDDAIDLLDKMEKRPELIAGAKKKPELLILKELLKAEALMRKKKEAIYFEDFLAGESKPVETAIREREPDLAARIILDEVEAYSIEKEWDKAIAAAQNPKISDAQMQKLFGDRKLGYEKFRFRLQFRLVEAFIGKKDFVEAEKELKNRKIKNNEVSILAEAKKLEETSSEPYLKLYARRVQAEAHLLLGNLYSYDWKGENYQNSLDHYNQALRLVQNDPSKEGKMILAKTYYGLGEIYRYGIKHRLESRANYEAAERTSKLLPVKSDDRRSLVARIDVGKARLEEQYGNLTQAYFYSLEAVKQLDQIKIADDDLKSEVNNLRNDLSQRRGLNLGTSYEYICGSDNRCESQVLFNINFPMHYISQYLKWLQLTTSQQIDNGPDGHISRSYFGFNLIGENIIPSTTVTLSYQLRMKGLFGGNDETDIRFIRRPAHKMIMSVWNKYCTFDGAFNADQYDFSHPDLNTYYAALRFNPSWARSRFLRGFRPGAAFLRYNFTGDGIFHKRNSIIPLSLHYDAKITNWWNLITEFNVLLFDSGGKWKPGIEFTIGSCVNLWRHSSVCFEYVRQQNAEYPMNFIRARFNLFTF